MCIIEMKEKKKSHHQIFTGFILHNFPELNPKKKQLEKLFSVCFEHEIKFYRTFSSIATKKLELF